MTLTLVSSKGLALLSRYNLTLMLQCYCTVSVCIWTGHQTKALPVCIILHRAHSKSRCEGLIQVENLVNC